ncbi:chlorophyll synthase ChlG [Halorhodospira neutriphila]|uniref:Bacteriochlorophyll/chlorophyll a synthase n=1 Tax=Halorhodospira neutriphila TaxID=168379 RepID=A0ABS1E3F6_9GAMM|nr:chlorophyll synthase ChlG [Halorhodospira neutriphila]MBK1726038.1 bacteriochlorophyll/chlorophyll a synthase [Halorhodospira neutriphila]
MSRVSLPDSALARPDPAAVLELMHPVTWFAPMWAFGCGVVSAGQVPVGLDWALVAVGVLLAGPLVCGTSQVINDWFDRDVDAVNEPDRPIPSGRVPGRWGLYLAVAATLLALVVAALLGPVVLVAATVGLGLAWAYSAPPLRLKRNGWISNAAVGLSYEGLPWVTGAAIMAGGLPDWRILLVAFLYSAGAHGIMTLNDFKAIEGDRQTGLLTVPVHLGAERAAQLACAVMAVPQAAVIALLLAWAQPWHALGVALLLGAQLVLMRRLLRDPKGNAPWYNATGTTLYVLGMLVTAFAVGGMLGGSA